MTESQIRFDDGAAYEHMMGVWSRLVGDAFLDWLAPAPGLRWLDIGCGNGAFTELLVKRCAPSHVLGIDPSEGQLAFARGRGAGAVASFQQGGALDLPVPEASVDAAVMALVLFFVPEPARGVAEMARVVRPGGMVSAYVWDLLEPGGFPGRPLQEAMGEFGVAAVLPPRPEVSRLDALVGLWRDAGLRDIRTHTITVERRFADFDDFWRTAETATTMVQALNKVAPEVIEAVKEKLRQRLPADAQGQVSYTARANAVAGRV